MTTKFECEKHFHHDWYYGKQENMYGNGHRWCKKCHTNQYLDVFDMSDPNWRNTYYNWQAFELLNFTKLLIKS